MVAIAHMSETRQVTIPDEVWDELHLEPGQPVEVVVHEGGVLIRPIDIDPDQAWFWTPEWQAKEREADEDIAAGRTEFHDSDEAFLAALRERAVRAEEKFVHDLRSGGFRAGLRVKRVRGRPGVWEMTWAPDGRATFSYGRSVREGEPHIIWRRIGTHDIFDNP